MAGPMNLTLKATGAHDGDATGPTGPTSLGGVRVTTYAMPKAVVATTALIKVIRPILCTARIAHWRLTIELSGRRAGEALPAVHPIRGAAGKARGVNAAAPMNC
jgi:hypothetical protein